jgi:hypothetical protein
MLLTLLVESCWGNEDISPVKSESSFAVVRFNERTYQSGGVVAVIKGIEIAQRTLNDFDWCQTEKAEGPAGAIS